MRNNVIASFSICKQRSYYMGETRDRYVRKQDQSYPTDFTCISQCLNDALSNYLNINLIIIWYARLFRVRGGGLGVGGPPGLWTWIRVREETGIQTLLTLGTRTEWQVIRPLQQCQRQHNLIPREKRRELWRVPERDALFLSIGCTEEECFSPRLKMLRVPPSRMETQHTYLKQKTCSYIFCIINEVIRRCPETKLS